MPNDTARQTSIDLNDAIWQIRPSIITWHLRRVILSGLGDNMTRICSWTTSASQPSFLQLLRSWVSNQSLHPNCQEQAAVPNLFGTRDQLHQKQFSQTKVGLGMIQAHYTYCSLYFYYYSISSTSDHEALDPRDWGLLTWRVYWEQEFAFLTSWGAGAIVWELCAKIKKAPTYVIYRNLKRTGHYIHQSFIQC